MVSAACRSCKILLVLATSSSMANLAIAVNYAATQHVSAISNSYSSGDSAPNPAYDHPGIAITASTGDTGYGVTSPASFDSVIAVGGTAEEVHQRPRLDRVGMAQRRQRLFEAERQAGRGRVRPTQCAGKAMADVAAVADPNTGVAMYDSLKFQGASGWQVYGGTSVGGADHRGACTRCQDGPRPIRRRTPGRIRVG